MRIAVISTVYKATPPSGYGGIERVVHTLVEQLVQDGHTVTLFGTSGSSCSGNTIAIPVYDPLKAPSAVKNKFDMISEEPLYETMRDYLRDHPVDFIHDWSFQNLFVLRHPEEFPFVISTCIPPIPDYQRPNLVASSRAHAGLFGNTTRYVYYGLDLDQWQYSFSKGQHFIHISKIAKYKSQHLAIRAARKSGKKLTLAGNIEDQLYYYLMVKPWLWMSPNVTYVGEIQGTNHHLLEAAALVQTPRWFDAFPLVILEAFASGTPVISFAEGGISEQIVDGVNGFLCKAFDDLVSAMDRVSEIKPQDCRAYAEDHFSVKRMAKDYVRLYQRVIDGEIW